MVTRMEYRRFSILPAINEEREYQINKYGSVRRSISEYILLMEAELQEAKLSVAKYTNENTLCELLQVIALGFACLEDHGVVTRTISRSPQDYIEDA